MKYQVVILAGGESSRFFPFNSLHKSFFKIAGKTILERTLESVKKLEPSEILLVLSSKNFDKEKKICETNSIFKDVRYIKEESPLGQADAILSAKDFIKDDFFVINATQFDFHKIAEEFIHKFEGSGYLATIGVTETDTPNKFGIAELENDRVKGIIEKPETGKEPSKMKVIGTYLLSHVFADLLAETSVSTYSLEETLNNTAKEGKVGSVRIKENLPSLKYPWDVLEMKNKILSEIKSFTDASAVIEKTAVLKGENIFIGKNAHIYDYAIIEGPVYISEDAVVGTYCELRGGSVLEKAAQIERYCDVKNSLVGERTHIHSRFLGDSVIGENCRIGAEFVTANKRLDRGEVKVMVKGEKVNTGRNDLGVIMGDGVKVGIRVTTMPGSVVGANSVVFPEVQVKGFYEEGSSIEK